MRPRTLKVTINGTGFAGGCTAGGYGMIPHKNGVAKAYENHREMAFIDLSEFVESRGFIEDELPDPRRLGAVFLRTWSFSLRSREA